MSLKPQEVRHLRGLAHKLKPVVMVGSAGLTDAVIAEFESAIEHHELIKVKVASDEREERSAIAGQFCDRTGSFLVQSIGKMLVFYRRSRKPKLKLS